MTNEIALETTDVVISGCGPTGAMISAYLGRLGVSNIVLEKEPAITRDPRGIALDDDGIRLMQGLGLYDKIFTEIGTYMRRVRFIGGVHSNLHAHPFLSMDMTSSEGQTGHVGVIGHNQPALESSIRSLITGQPKFCQLRSQCTLVAIHEDNDSVIATYTDAKGLKKKVRSRFLVAADGKTGYTRKNYLEPKGIQMEWAENTKYSETWVALNWKISLPTRESHPSFPLWDLGYTSSDVYDAFFPTDFRFLCSPERPAVCGRFGLHEDRLWRFEFVVSPGEDGNEMAKPHKIKEIVYPFITHLGCRYGLSNDVEFPKDCIKVLRARPFQFSARSCNKWAKGRVILAGDAAHVFPPFGGQGIVSGFRDAISLVWRLAILIENPRKLDHEAFLNSWYKERKQQLDHSLAATVRNGTLVCTNSRLKDFFRTWIFWAAQFVPSWKASFESRDFPPVQYVHKPGMPFVPEMSGGRAFPQTYCAALTSPHEVQFTDSVIFTKEKKNLFQFAVMLGDIEELKLAVEDLDSISYVGSHLSAKEATFFVPRTSDPTLEGQGGPVAQRIFRSASGEEFGESHLCMGRPSPHGYNEFLMWQSVAWKKYVILRYDRFVFAACDTKEELQKAVYSLESIVG